MLTRNITTEKMDVSHAWYGDDCCTIEHQWLGTEPGEFLGIPGTDGRSRSACCTSLSSSKDESHARTCGSTATRSSPSYLAQPERRPAPQGRRPVHGTERLAQRLVLSTAASASKVEGTSEQYAHTQRFSRGEAPASTRILTWREMMGWGRPERFGGHRRRHRPFRARPPSGGPSPAAYWFEVRHLEPEPELDIRRVVHGASNTIAKRADPAGFWRRSQRCEDCHFA
jgi:hypothetical protein